MCILFSTGRIICLKLLVLFVLIVGVIPGVVSQEVISTSGSYLMNSAGSISFTIGEPVVKTLSNSSLVLTQGFNQTYLTITSIAEHADQDFPVYISPNPASTFIKMVIEKEILADLRYQLLDSEGRLLKEGKIESSETEISLEGLPHTAFFLWIIEKNMQIRAFKIIKTR